MASSIRGEPRDLSGAARISRRDAIAGAAFSVAVASLSRLAGSAAPQSQLTWGVHISLAPTWFDPAETPGIIFEDLGRGEASAAGRPHRWDSPPNSSSHRTHRWREPDSNHRSPS